jgi:pimeloyl-ACP methyl ester carboxylesterase
MITTRFKHPHTRAIAVAAMAMAMMVGLATVAIAVTADPEGTVDEWDARQGPNRLRRPIIFVHGVDAFGESGVDCSGWNGLKQLFRDNDPKVTDSARLVAVQYYSHDTNCGSSISKYGDHGTHYGSGHENGEHTSETNIRHLAYHFAWYVNRVWNVDDTHVDIVAHSMGGLIARYALAQVARGNSEFPSRLLVDDVITAGTPHAGARALAELCFWNLECQQMDRGSEFMTWLADNAMRPKPIDRTDWTLIGSEDDNVVASTSATSMGTATTRLVYGTDNNIEHGDYYENRGLWLPETAHWLLWKKQGKDDWAPYEWGRWPGRWAQRALYFNDL